MSNLLIEKMFFDFESDGWFYFSAVIGDMEFNPRRNIETGEWHIRFQDDNLEDEGWSLPDGGFYVALLAEQSGWFEKVYQIMNFDPLVQQLLKDGYWRE